MCSGSGFLLIVNFVSFVPVFCLIFHASIDLSINCSLSWYARDAGFSHMYTESLKIILWSVKIIFWGGVRGCGAIYYWLLSQDLSPDTISIFFSFLT